METFIQQDIRVKLTQVLFNFNKNLFVAWKHSRAYKNAFSTNDDIGIGIETGKRQPTTSFPTSNKNCDRSTSVPKSWLYLRLMSIYGKLCFAIQLSNPEIYCHPFHKS